MLAVADTLKEALAYAARGWPVFPCKAEDKSPLTGRGFKDASKDPEQIKWWFGQKFTHAMIGVPTGWKIGAFVLDINPPEGMTIFQAFAAIQAVGGLGCVDTATTETPNGLHLWFRMLPDVEIRNRGPLLGGAIDCIRGEGGYVIVPPSRRDDGRRYSWVGANVLASPSAELIELVRPQ